jgi:ferrochelatase
MRWQPAIRTLPPYHDDPAHIAALTSDVTRQLQALPFVPEVLLLSFHGMPERTLHLGDPYHCQCRKTARLLGEALAPLFPALRVETAFQSRFGRAKWLEPSTEAVLEAEAKKGTRKLAIVAPGFSADCVETLEELAIRGREVLSTPAVRISRCSPASMRARRAWQCSKRWCGASCPAGPKAWA